MPCICSCCIYCFFPLFSPLDFETDATTAAPINYGVDDPSFSAELPRKQTPLDQPDIAHSLLSYSCIRFAIVVDSIAPILLHSLSLLLQLLIPLPAILYA